jgi:hypothetical protein
VGKFQGHTSSVELDVRGLARPSQVLVDGQALTTWDLNDDRLLVNLPAGTAARTVTIASSASG